MSQFRSPIYLDEDQLIPLANYHEIEVLKDVSVSEKDVGKRERKAAGRAAIPGGFGPSLELGGQSGSEVEYTRSQTVTDHPITALNRLVDALSRDELLKNSIDDISKRDIIELDLDLEISSATDVGNLLGSMLGVFANNPGAFSESEPPPEVVQALIGGQVKGQIVLTGESPDSASLPVLVLANSEFLIQRAIPDDLEGQRTVFGLIDTLVGENQSYSLTKLFMAGVPRSIRRAFDAHQMLEGFSSAFDRPIDPSELEIRGPLVVIRAISVY